MVYTFDQGPHLPKEDFSKSQNLSPISQRENQKSNYRLEGIIEQYSEQNQFISSELDRLAQENSRFIQIEKTILDLLSI